MPCTDMEAASHSKLPCMKAPTPSMTVAKTKCLKNAVLADSIVLTVQTVLVCSTAAHTRPTRNQHIGPSLSHNGDAPM